jgi:hypothetical protein
MKRIKCKLVPLEEFYKIPPITCQDELYSYFRWTTKQGKEHVTKIKRKNCSYCGLPAVWVGVFKYTGYSKPEPLCYEHGSKFSDGNIPSRILIPQVKSKPVILNR